MKKIYTLLTIVAVMSFGVTKNAIAQAPQPLAHYQFNETSDSLLVDRTDNGFDAWSNCDTCWEAAGYLDGCFHFDGHKAPLPADEMGMTSEEGTVAFWLLLPNNGSSINVIWWGAEYGGNTFGPENEMHMHVEGGPNSAWAGGEASLFIRDSVNATTYFLYSDPWDGGLGNTPSGQGILVNDSTWHHVAATWGPYYALYIDGQPVWDTSYYYGATYPLNKMCLGMTPNNTGRALHGYLDEFRIYDVALEAIDIADIYAWTDVENDKISGANDLSLRNYPNPVTENTTFRYELSAESTVTLEIYNQVGQLVRTLVSENQSAGIHTVPWNGCNDGGQALSSGIYMYRLQAGNKVQTKSLMIVR